MSAELNGILSLGAALAALELSGRLSIDRRMTGRIVEMVGRLADMDWRMARVEGLLVGLVLSGRIDAPPAGN